MIKKHQIGPLELSIKLPSVSPPTSSAFAPYPLFQWYLPSKEILLNLGMKMELGGLANQTHVAWTLVCTNSFRFLWVSLSLSSHAFGCFKSQLLNPTK